MSSFRLHGVNLFLTYPQCTVEPKDAQLIIKSKLKHYQWAVIAREAHADGHPHLHAFVRLAKPCNFTAPTCLDIPGAGNVVCHGNYQIARDPKASLDYVCKDGNVECFDTTLDAARSLFSAAGRKRTATEVIMDGLKAGMDITEVAEMHPEHMTFCMLHKDRLEAFFTQTLLAQLKPQLTFVKAQTKFPPNLFDSQICQWLNKNLFQTRPFSQPQLWIWGPTCHGKTTLKNELEKSTRIYTVPNEEFYDDYKDTLYDLVILDEVGPGQSKRIQWMNQFCDGSAMPLRQKGKQTVKRVNLPVIVLSNHSIRGVYCQCPENIYETIKRRFVEIELGSPMAVEIVTTPRKNQEPSPDTSIEEAVTDQELADLIPVIE